MANPSVRSTSSAAGQTASTFSVSKPAGTVDGDLLIAFQNVVQSSGGTPSPPTGWTSLGNAAYGLGSVDSLSCFYKSASSEPASWTFNNGGSVPESSVYIFCVQNAPAAPNGGAGSASNGGASTTADPGNPTAPDANDLVLAAWADDVGSGFTPSITPDGSYTALGLIGGSAESLNAGSKTKATSGSVTNNTAALSSGMGTPNWGAFATTVSPVVTPTPPPLSQYPALPRTILTM